MVLKILMFLFPFIKELFIGQNEESFKKTLKIIFLVIAIGSIWGTFHFMSVSYRLAERNIELKTKVELLQTIVDSAKIPTPRAPDPTETKHPPVIIPNKQKTTTSDLDRLRGIENVK